MENKNQIQIPSRRKNLIYFLGSLLVAVVATWLIRDPSFTRQQTLVMFLLIFSVGLWLTEAVSPFSVGLFIIAFLFFTQGKELFVIVPAEVGIYVNMFSSSVIWLLLGGFFFSTAMIKTQLDKVLIDYALKICGNDPKWILFGIMAVTMVTSNLISNTATAAMVLAAVMPVVLILGKDSPVSKGLILGVPLAATTGGMGTLVGTPPNPIAAEALAKAGQPIDFTSWIYYGLPLAIVLTFIAWLVLVRVFMKGAKPLAINAAGNNVAVPEINKTHRTIVVLVLMVTIFMWLSNPLHGLSAAAVSAIPLVVFTLCGIITGKDVQAMGWDTLLLVAGGLALGKGLQEAGLLDYYAARIAAVEIPDYVFYLVLGYATMLFSNIMSGTATCTVLIPLGMAILPEHKTEVAMIIALSASCGLALPVSCPPNAIVYSTGLIKQKDLLIGGALIGLLGPALIFLWVIAIS
jgi:sodium-dependent dicarboxylate transporter 2/3/5